MQCEENYDKDETEDYPPATAIFLAPLDPHVRLFAKPVILSTLQVIGMV